MKRGLRKLGAFLSGTPQIRTAVLDLWNSVRHEVVTVEQWNRKVIVRALTLDEWLEYNRMATLLGKAASVEDEPGEVLPEEPWQKYGHSALYAFVLVATLYDRRRRPVFAPAGTPERAQDIAAVASGFSDVHDQLVARALLLSGVQVPAEGEPPIDPVDQAGND